MTVTVNHWSVNFRIIFCSMASLLLTINNLYQELLNEFNAITLHSNLLR